MQTNQHLRLQQEMTPTPNDAPVSQVIYPQLPIQVGQPLPQPQIQPQVVYQTYTQQPQLVYNANARPVIPHMQSKYPQIVTCHYCQQQVQTVVNYEAGNGAYVIGGLMAAVGLWLGCCLIPCFVDDCKDAIHFCPACQANLGKKKFLFD